MFGLEKFLKKQKEPVEKDKINPCFYQTIKEFHCQQVLKDGKLYSTEKAEKIFEFDGTAYFKTPQSNFFFADFYVTRTETVRKDGAREVIICIRYCNLHADFEVMHLKQKLGKYDIELYKKYFGEPEEG